MMEVLVILESLTGNTRSFVDFARERYGDSVNFTEVDTYDFIQDSEWEKYDKVMIGAYTWNMGKIPIVMKEFIIDHRDKLLEQDVLIFGSGWSVYETFCQAVDNMGIILDNKFPKVKFELRFDEELEKDAIKTLDKFIKGE